MSNTTQWYDSCALVMAKKSFTLLMSLGLNITAAKFNLRSYELWSHKLQLTWDDPVLKNFVGESAANITFI